MSAPAEVHGQRFALTDQTYDVREVLNIHLVGLNFVTLDSGVCVCLNEDEKLEMFSKQKNASTTTGPIPFGR